MRTRSTTSCDSIGWTETSHPSSSRYFILRGGLGTSRLWLRELDKNYMPLGCPVTWRHHDMGYETQTRVPTFRGHDVSDKPQTWIVFPDREAHPAGTLREGK